METIKNYLESMFRSLPKTEKVNKAKQELFQMMEDKYTELISEGKSENEAVGTVISEFGNLDDLADDLGIIEELTEKKTIKENARKVTKEEVQDFLSWRKKVSIIRGVGIALCILCVVSPMILDSFFNGVVGVCGFFVSIAVGVGLIIYSSMKNTDFEFLLSTPCVLDEDLLEDVKNKKKDFSKTYSIYTIIAIGFFILSCLPSILFSVMNSNFFDNIGGAGLFVFIAVGVFLLIFANIQNDALNFLVSLNENPYFANKNNKQGDTKTKKYYRPQSFEDSEDEREIATIKNPTIRKVLSVFWPTITCFYLITSFLTCKWHITWIIWPIAGLAFTLIKTLSDKEEK